MEIPHEFQIIRLKRLLKHIKGLTGGATSLVTLIISPGTQISQIIDNVNGEIDKASNIKSRVNRQSVESALVSIVQKLRLYPRCPENGLVIYCGEIDGKKYIWDIIPPRPINCKGYSCGSSFDTTVLEETLADSTTYGFIIVDGNGVLYATLSGDAMKILPNGFDVDLPKKHGRGGQSALRFSRLRTEKRHNYIRKVAEEAVKCFISDNVLNVKGIVLAGSAELKSELAKAELLDPRLKESIVCQLDIAYGGSNGLKQAIDLSAEKLTGLKMNEEILAIRTFFDEMVTGSDKYEFGLRNIYAILSSGIIETVLIWESYQKPHPEIPGTGFLEWLMENYQQFGCQIMLVSEKTAEGCQFVKGFEGLGAILRYPKINNLDDPDNLDGFGNDLGDIDDYL